MINERHRTYISNSRAYRCADANSDLNPVIANIKIYLKVKKCSKRKPTFSLDALHNPEIGAEFSKHVLKKISQTQRKQDPQSQRTNIKTSMTMAANKVIPKKSKKIKQPHWITDEIKQLMEKRRKYKTDPDQYKEIHKEI